MNWLWLMAQAARANYERGDVWMILFFFSLGYGGGVFFFFLAANYWQALGKVLVFPFRSVRHLYLRGQATRVTHNDDSVRISLVDRSWVFVHGPGRHARQPKQSRRLGTAGWLQNTWRQSRQDSLQTNRAWLAGWLAIWAGSRCRLGGIPNQIYTRCESNPAASSDGQ